MHTPSSKNAFRQTSLPDDYVMSALCIAIRENMRDLVFRFLEHSGAAFVNQPTVTQSSLLHIAAEKGDAGITQALLDVGAAVNAVDKQMRSPLYTAVAGRHLETARALIRHGADVAKYEITVKKPLLAALLPSIVAEDHALVGLLLDAGADPDATDPSGTPMLMRYAEINAKEAVAAILHAGADPLRLALPPISLALYHGMKKDIIAHLLRSGTEPDPATLYLAVMRHDPELVNLLLSHGADPLVTDQTGKTPWAIAQKAMGDDNPITARLKLAEDAARATVARAKGLRPQ